MAFYRTALSVMSYLVVAEAPVTIPFPENAPQFLYNRVLFIILVRFNSQ